MKQGRILRWLVMSLCVASIGANAFAEETEASDHVLTEEIFQMECKVQEPDGNYVYDAEVAITVELPADYYENTDKMYPVCYVLDGSEELAQENDVVGFHNLYDTRGDEFPEVIYVGIDPPGPGAVRTAAYGAPFGTTMFMKDLERAEMFVLDGSGDYFISWIADTLKPYIDENYRTLSGVEDTAIFGFSSGGTCAIIAGLLRPDTFSRVGAFSPSTWLWSNWFYGVLENPGHIYQYETKDGVAHNYAVEVDKIANLFMYQGGCDGSSGNDKNALNDVTNVYNILVEKGAGYENHKYINYAEGTHGYTAWAEFLPNCLLTLVPDVE